MKYTIKKGLSIMKKQKNESRESQKKQALKQAEMLRIYKTPSTKLNIKSTSDSLYENVNAYYPTIQDIRKRSC